MNYVGNIIRPPSEAYSMIIQVTVGCSHNQCTFCRAYKGEKFYIKDINIIKQDIDEASSYDHAFNKAFLADGDALILPTKRLLEIISYIREKNKSIKRIGVYANTKAILKKTVTELIELKDAGLGIIYQGIESGNKEVLKKTQKGAFPHKQIIVAEKVKQSKILLSQTVLLGIGGRELSISHAIDTGKHLGEMSPDYASALTTMIIPDTKLFEYSTNGKFDLPDKFEILNELKLIIENMNVKNNCFFTSNHASNYLPIRAFLPKDKNELIKLLDKIINSRDSSRLRPENYRAL